MVGAPPVGNPLRLRLLAEASALRASAGGKLGGVGAVPGPSRAGLPARLLIAPPGDVQLAAGWAAARLHRREPFPLTRASPRVQDANLARPRAVAVNARPWREGRAAARAGFLLAPAPVDLGAQSLPGFMVELQVSVSALLAAARLSRESSGRTRGARIPVRSRSRADAGGTTRRSRYTRAAGCRGADGGT